MEKWYCFKCKEEAVLTDIKTSYMEMEGSARGWKCPKCGLIALTEDDVMEIAEQEQLLESKA